MKNKIKLIKKLFINNANKRQYWLGELLFEQCISNLNINGKNFYTTPHQKNLLHNIKLNKTQTGNKLNEIKAESAHDAKEALLSIINKERGLGTLTSWEIEDNKEDIKNNNLKILPIPSNPYGLSVIYREGFEKQAKELKDIAEKYEGYLPCSPNQKISREEVKRIGQLLSYDEKDIEDFLNDEFGKQIKENDPFGLIEFIKEIAKEEYKIYLDQDGVLADFDQRFIDLSGISAKEFEEKYGTDEFWDFIDEKNKIKFWVGIPVMDGAKELVDFAKDYDYEILTSPSLKSQSLLGKRLWVKNHIGDIFPSMPKINFKFSKEKHTIKDNLTKYDILVDDKQRTIDTWNKEGGTGIFYKNSQQTISDLKKIVT